MINNDTALSVYTAESGQSEYEIGFKYFWNLDDTPQIKVVLGKPTGDSLVYGTDYTISANGLNIVFVVEPEEGTRINISRNVPFTQTSDYVIGRIDPDQIERDFDLAVMRAQQAETEAESKLPLSGGQMYGPISWGKEDLSVGYINASGNTEEQKAMLFGVFDENHEEHTVFGIRRDKILPATNATSIGTQNARFNTIWGYTIYANDLQAYRIHAGANSTIIVPNQNGTMVVAEPPRSNGTYVLKATYNNGVFEIAWVLEE